VTGGAGFIGSHLVALLLERGWRVRVFDNLSGGDIENLPARFESANFIHGDIRDFPAVRRACEGVDFVFHLAAQVSVVESIRMPVLTGEINIGGTLNLLEAAASAGVRRVIFSSSCAVYGDAPEQPKHEGLPVAPLSPYAISKLTAEQFGEFYRLQRNLSVVSLRYFNVYGPGQNPRSDYAAAVPRFIAQALQGDVPVIFGTGDQTRDFVFVGDIALANLRAATASLPRSGLAVFNVGTGRSISVNELWERIAAITGVSPHVSHAPPRAGEVLHSRACTRCASEQLGFTPQTALDEGLALTVADFRRRSAGRSEP
jgi:UDP-glucose 4-epimerase